MSDFFIVPLDIAQCPVCKRQLIFEVEKWEKKRPILFKSNIMCSDTKNLSGKKYTRHFQEHYLNYDVDWEQSIEKVYQWADSILKRQ